jgi:outer membrane receptor for ferrienterochelin and colicins
MPRLSTAPAASCAATAFILIASSSAVFAATSDSADTDSADTDASSAAGGPSSSTPLAEIQVTAQHLNDARSSIETQTGASTYTIDAQAIAAIPGGENNQLNQVLLQAPDVV